MRIESWHRVRETNMLQGIEMKIVLTYSIKGVSVIAIEEGHCMRTCIAEVWPEKLYVDLFPLSEFAIRLNMGTALDQESITTSQPLLQKQYQSHIRTLPSIMFNKEVLL